MRRLLAAPVLLASGCLIHVGSNEPRVWVSTERTFEVDPDDLAHVSCSTHNGDVAVLGADADSQILIRVAIRAGGEDEADAQAALDAVEILHKRKDGGLALSSGWREPYHRTWQAVVSFDVTQPRSLPSRVETHNGDVRVSGIAAPVTAESHNGDLVLRDCGGDVRGSTHNGDIEANVSSPDLSLSSHNGNLKVLVDGEGPLAGEIRTYNGGIRFTVAPERSARLVCTAENGRVACDRRLKRVERSRHFLVADLGKAEGRLAIETHNGSIRIE